MIHTIINHPWLSVLTWFAISVIISPVIGKFLSQSTLEFPPHG